MKFLIYVKRKLQTDGDEWKYKYADNGEYTVHPVPGLG